MISGGSQAAAVGADRFAHAYQALRADSSVQFKLTPPEPPPQPPAWLKTFTQWMDRVFAPVGRFLKWIGSYFPDAAYARIFLWTVIGLGAAALLWALYNRIRHGEWRLRLPRRARVTDVPDEEEWAPEEAGARSWLQAQHMTWLTPKRLRAATVTMFVVAGGVSTIGLSGSSTPVHAPAHHASSTQTR